MVKQNKFKYIYGLISHFYLENQLLEIPKRKKSSHTKLEKCERDICLIFTCSIATVVIIHIPPQGALFEKWDYNSPPVSVSQSFSLTLTNTHACTNTHLFGVLLGKYSQTASPSLLLFPLPSFLSFPFFPLPSLFLSSRGIQLVSSLRHAGNQPLLFHLAQ